MGRLNVFILLNIGIQVLITFAVMVESDVLAMIMGAFLLVSLVGAVMIAVSAQLSRIGAYVFIVGCVAYVPIGLVGARP